MYYADANLHQPGFLSIKTKQCQTFIGYSFGHISTANHKMGKYVPSRHRT